jgi:hypothetical protein
MPPTRERNARKKRAAAVVSRSPGLAILLDFARVHRAVAAGESDEELRRVIEDCAQGDDQRRKAAANRAVGEETPPQAVHRQRRGDLVGALVEAGADVGAIFSGRLTLLAVCIAYGQAGSVRVAAQRARPQRAHYVARDF